LVNLSIIPNFLQILLVFSPIYALLFLYIEDRFKRSHIYLIATISFVIGIYIFVFEPFRYIDYRLSKAFSLYPPFLSISLLVIGRKHKPGRTLILSLMLIYLLTELHEVPAFIRIYFGWYDNVNALKHYYVWFTPLNHLYSIVVGYVFFKIAKVKLNEDSISLFLVGLIVSFLLYPVRIYRTMTLWEYVIRVFWLPVLLYLVEMGEE